LFSSLPVGALVAALSGNWKDFRTAALATAMTLGCFIVWHIVRAPWLLHQTDKDQAKEPGPWWGVVGFLAVCAVLVGGIVLGRAVTRTIPAPPVANFRPPMPPTELPPRTVYRDRPVPASAPTATPSTPDQEKAKREQERTTLAKLLEEGAHIEDDCLTTTPNQALPDRAEDWAKRTYTFLGSIDTASAARFNAASGLSFSHTNVPEPNNSVWNYVNQHSQVLSQILSELGHD